MPHKPVSTIKTKVSSNVVGDELLYEAGSVFSGITDTQIKLATKSGNRRLTADALDQFPEEFGRWLSKTVTKEYTIFMPIILKSGSL